MERKEYSKDALEEDDELEEIIALAERVPIQHRTFSNVSANNPIHHVIVRLMASLVKSFNTRVGHSSSRVSFGDLMKVNSKTKVESSKSAPLPPLSKKMKSLNAVDMSSAKKAALVPLEKSTPTCPTPWRMMTLLSRW